LLAAGPAAQAAAPAPLSARTGLPDVASSFGSGSFGAWGVDAKGCRVYHYTADQQADPHARPA